MGCRLNRSRNEKADVCRMLGAIMGKEKKSAKLRFSKRLVLNQYMLQQFGAKNFSDISQDLKQSNLEEIDSEGVTGFLPRIIQKKNILIPKDKLQEYDRNIVRHLRKINVSRDKAIHLKYFQYLSLLFVEFYLDSFFNCKESLLKGLNETITAFNEENPKEKLPSYEESELNKIALWNATGSGKTILMHINYYQYLHYASKSISTDTSIILLTPNEGLSKQHIDDFRVDGIKADFFDKNASRNFFSDNLAVCVLENTKLSEKDGDKTVAVSRFGNQNLVFVDEGHKGSSGDKWMNFRNELCKAGFSFEYSATFGQAVGSVEKENAKLAKQYAKCILFDYSYAYFYGDGYGKDYKIIDMNDVENEQNTQKYLTACLLTFYQQKKLFTEHITEIVPFNIENPLFVFVGHSVTGGSDSDKATLTDVAFILDFFRNFVSKKDEYSEYIKELINGNSGLLCKNRDIFANSFSNIESYSPEIIYADILSLVFNAQSNGELYIANVKGIDGEIAIRIGDNEPFGLINVGDSSGLIKILKENKFNASTLDIGHSIFQSVNKSDSKISILVGSKKFTEGWNCWRVSTMGLMNVGKNEGSEIIQLFGRGVRLKGYNFSLKRSKCYKRDDDNSIKVPNYIENLETLNVFGIRSDYMRKFREELSQEDIPVNNEDIFQIQLPVIKNKSAFVKKLKTLRLPEGVDFKKLGPKPILKLWLNDRNESKFKVELNLYSNLQVESSLQGESYEKDLGDGKTLNSSIVNLFDFDAIWLELEAYKNEKNRHNVIIEKENLQELLLSEKHWYKIYTDEDLDHIKTFSDIQHFQSIAITLLKKYFDKFYSITKSEWETPQMKYFEMDENDPNILENEEYSVSIEKPSKHEELKTFVEQLKVNLEEAKITGDITNLTKDFNSLMISYASKNCCYNPFLYIANNLTEIKISPVALVKSEYNFVKNLKDELEKDRLQDILGIAELYIIRNKSKKGVGFFVDSGFYPDFIMWILKDNKQYITFIDPHGMGRESIDGAKVNLYKFLKDIESRLQDKNVVLNSFILSPTEYSKLVERRKKEDWIASHVLFMKDDKDYIQQLIEGVLR